MYSYKKKDLPKNTLEIEVLIPWNDILAEKNKVFEEMRKKLTVNGFRKGKVPKDVAEKKIPKENVYQEVIKELLNKIFSQIVTKEHLDLIAYPKVELKKAKENEDWLVIMTMPLRPKVDLGNYKEEIKKIKKYEKKADIWVPGKDIKPSESSSKENLSDQKLLSKVLERLLEVATCEISDIVIEEELNKRLSQLYDDLQKLGLTIEAYLKSKNLTVEKLKEQIKKEIEETYKLEFILQEISDKENITVEPSDLEKLLSSISDPKEKEAARSNSYFYSTLLRKQKTLDFLLNL